MLLIKAVMNKLIVTLSLFFLKPVYIEIKIIFLCYPGKEDNTPRVIHLV